MTFLPFDYSRCNGKPAGPQKLGVEPECLACLRRTAPWGDRQSVIGPSTESPCPNRIDPTPSTPKERRDLRSNK